MLAACRFVQRVGPLPAFVVFLGIAIFSGPVLERSMSLHMLVHIPLIFAAGVALAQALRNMVDHARRRSVVARCAAWLAQCNQYGIAGLLFATLAGMYWMIPRALDEVLLSHAAMLGKYISIMLAGICVADAWRRAHRVILLFFVGGFCWTSAIAGMLYQESSARLCNFYLLDDQVWAGRGLVILAIMIPVGWVLAEVRAHQRRPTPRNHAEPLEVQEQT